MCFSIMVVEWSDKLLTCTFPFLSLDKKASSSEEKKAASSSSESDGRRKG